MENSKRGTRKRIVRTSGSENRSEKVDYSTSRSYSSGDHKPSGDRKPYGAAPRKSGYGKPAFGSKPGSGRPGNGRPGSGKPGFNKRKPADEGMSQMLSRKPQVSGNKYSDNDNVKTEIQEVVRLNKFIANSGVCSRREADTLIQSGVVTVNGEVVTELGTKVNILKDDIRFNGERLKGEEKV